MIHKIKNLVDESCLLIIPLLTLKVPCHLGAHRALIRVMKGEA